MTWTFWKYITEHDAMERGSRSSVVTNLMIMGLVFGTCLILSAREGAATWIQIFFASLCGTDFLAFLAAYGYFAYRSPDSLRSERFFLKKLAIERGLLGDAESGLIPGEETLRSPGSTANKIKRLEKKS
jgi:hypothetical protein